MFSVSLSGVVGWILVRLGLASCLVMGSIIWCNRRKSALSVFVLFEICSDFTVLSVPGVILRVALAGCASVSVDSLSVGCRQVF